MPTRVSGRRRGRRNLSVSRAVFETLETRRLLSFTSALASFDGVTGATPYGGLVRDSNGNLYGTTEYTSIDSYGYGAGSGIVFELAKGTSQIKSLASFNGTSTVEANGGLIMDSSGDLLGATSLGGANSYGSIFEVVKGTSSIKTLASFSDVIGFPNGPIAVDSSGNVYGTADYGGSNGVGAIFEVAKGTTTVRTLASFDSNETAAQGLVIDSNGNLYGLSQSGGASYAGTVFELQKGHATISVLATFDMSNGGYPVGTVVFDSSSDLFGASSLGGTASLGTIFELTKGSSTISTLASFNGTNGETPAALLRDSSGNFWGVTKSGGTGSGVIFELAKGSTTITDPTEFNGTDGTAPLSLIMDSQGDFFGTTQSGGAHSDGAIFQLSSDQLVFTHQPSSITAGSTITPAITVSVENQSNQVLTTDNSTVTLSVSKGPGTLTGTFTAAMHNGVATFATLSGTTAGTYVLAAADVADSLAGFKSSSFTIHAASATKLAIKTQPVSFLAEYPFYPLLTVAVEDKYGNVATSNTSAVTIDVKSGPGTFVGTPVIAAINGVATFSYFPLFTPGNYTLNATDGALPPVTSAKVASYEPITVLTNFYGSDGSLPYSGLVMDSDGNLYGTTNFGGSQAGGGGNIFELVKGSPTVTTLAWLNQPTAYSPYGDLAMDSSGDLFGTTKYGGTSSDGTVFELVKGAKSITILGSFNGNNGANPMGAVILDKNGNLYGTSTGGSVGDGTVFEIAKGTKSIKVLATFNGTDGQSPIAGVLMDSNGNLFGTTELGGNGWNSTVAGSGYGTIYEIANGSHSITDLAKFNGINGAIPFGGVVEDSSGNLYGATSFGGTGWKTAKTFLYENGGGTVFKLAKGSSTITVLADGGGTTNTLLLASNGDLYGTGAAGAAGGVFEVSKNGGAVTTIAAFNGDDGNFPTCNLITDSKGDLFGTTWLGGLDNGGVVFEIPVPVPTADHLAILSQPANVTAGQTMPAVKIAIEDQSDNIVTTNTSMVSIALYGGTVLSLGGTLAVKAINGVATFGNLSMTAASDDNAFTFADGPMAVVTSNPFSVAPAAATKLVFFAQPLNAASGATLQSIIVTLEDKYGNVANSSATVTLSLASAPSGAVLNGTLIQPMFYSAATFQNLSLDVRGTYTLTATGGGFTSSPSNRFVIS